VRYYIENDFLKAAFDTRGAELKSVQNKSGFEFIWQAGEIWPRSAPILFPVVGTLKNHQYQFEGKTFEMTHHGFARDSEFIVLHQSAHSICFLLSNYGEEPAENYPFNYHFLVTYTLSKNELIQKFRVINKGENHMPFSFGAHPAFNLQEGQQYEITFEKSEEALSYTIEDGLISEKMRAVIEKNTIQIAPDTFDEDALVFDKLQSNKVVLHNIEKSHTVSVTIQNFPYLGIWAKPNAPFVCIEPWVGIADFTDAQGDILQKKGIITLQIGEEFEREFRMVFWKEC
jgi:galactose mutarotase-like enzyme